MSSASSATAPLPQAAPLETPALSRPAGRSAREETAGLQLSARLPLHAHRTGQHVTQGWPERCLPAAGATPGGGDSPSGVKDFVLDSRLQKSSSSKLGPPAGQLAPAWGSWGRGLAEEQVESGGGVVTEQRFRDRLWIRSASLDPAVAAVGHAVTQPYASSQLPEPHLRAVTNENSGVIQPLNGFWPQPPTQS